jgi:AcrR family transcriptional regulator
LILDGMKQRGVELGATDQVSTHDRALAIATEMFSERGFHGVSIGHVAEALGYTKQAVLHYFPSKEKLYGAVLAGIAEDFEAVLNDAKRRNAQPEAQLQQVFAALQNLSGASRTRTRLLVRELMDVEMRAEAAKGWPLRSFLDELTAMGRAIPAWREKTDAEVFAALYQLIGAVSYFAISEATLTGMYGRRRTVAIRRAFTGELATLLACATSCHGAEK